MTHALKTLSPYYSDVISGKKTFELRKDDRPFELGDKLLLQEYDPENGGYTGAEETLYIDYILRDCPQYGLMEGYCIIGLKEIMM